MTLFVDNIQTTIVKVLNPNYFFSNAVYSLQKSFLHYIELISWWLYILLKRWLCFPRMRWTCRTKKEKVTHLSLFWLTTPFLTQSACFSLMCKMPHLQFFIRVSGCIITKEFTLDDLNILEQYIILRAIISDKRKKAYHKRYERITTG